MEHTLKSFLADTKFTVKEELDWVLRALSDSMTVAGLRDVRDGLLVVSLWRRGVRGRQGAGCPAHRVRRVDEDRGGLLCCGRQYHHQQEAEARDLQASTRSWWVPASMV